MPDVKAPTAVGVTVSIARDPALVRTVRLIAAAVARRAGGDEEFVEEVRLAVGEACALMIGERIGGQHAVATSTEPVTVAMSLNGRLSVEVATTEAPEAFHEAGELEPWALLRGLVDDFAVARVGVVTTVSMSFAA